MQHGVEMLVKEVGKLADFCTRIPRGTKWAALFGFGTFSMDMSHAGHRMLPYLLPLPLLLTKAKP